LLCTKGLTVTSITVVKKYIRQSQKTRRVFSKKTVTKNTVFTGIFRIAFFFGKKMPRNYAQKYFVPQ